MNKLTHLSLFSGIGGIDLAAEAAGFETVCQCEWADFPTMVLEKRWPDVPRFRDITTLTKEAFYEKTGQKTVTLISGGFPCQPFSSAGAQKGFSDTRYLWHEMARVISELHPSWVLGENVAGFIHMGLDKTILDLEREGYNVQTFVYPACGVGAWHERTRTFIVGVDVSHTACKRQSHGKGSEKFKCVSVRRRDIQKEKSERHNMEPAAFGGGVLSHTYSVGRFPFDLEAGNNADVQRQIKPCSTDNKVGNTDKRNSSTQSGLGGMADGIPPQMDGRKLWQREPSGILRVTDETENRSSRLKTLGNAVCPSQVYPILKCIADIETGVCKDRCVFGGTCNG